MRRAAMVGLLTAGASSALAQRAVEEGVILRADVGFQHVTTKASGDPDLQGNDPGAALRDPTQFVDVGLAIGTRKLGYSPLNTYVLGQFLLDLGGTPKVDEAVGHPSVLHAYGDARRLALHLAYAELDGFTEGGALANLHLRAGRQFHWGPVGFTFDGATLAYDDGTLAVALRGGRRAGVFAEEQDDPGLLAGLDLAYALGGRQGLSLRAEYLYFTRELTLDRRDTVRLVPGEETVDYTVHLAEVGAFYDITREVLVSLRASLVAPEVSHVRGALRWALGASTLLVDVDEKIGRDLSYDLAGGRGVVRRDRNTTYEALRLNIADRQPFTDGQATLELALTDGFNLVPQVGVRATHGEAANLTPYDANQVRWGLGGYYDLPFDAQSGLELELSYGGTRYDRTDEEHFDDAGAGGERVAHNISAGVRYARGRRVVGNRVLGGRIFTAGIHAYQDIWVLGNRFIDDTDERAGGIGAQVQWAFTEWTSVRGAYEFARDSTVFSRWVEPFHGVRIALEGHL